MAGVFIFFVSNEPRITLYFDGKEQVVEKGTALSVGDLLTQNGIFLNEGDKLFPPGNTLLSNGMVVMLQRIANPIYSDSKNKTRIKIAKTGEAIVENKKELPFEKIETPSNRIPKGKVVISQRGRPGTLLERFRLILWQGREVRRELIGREVVSRPRNAVYLIGRGIIPVFRGERRVQVPPPPNSGQIKQMEATGYWPWVNGTGIARNGMKAKRGIVAVDPGVIPIGTRVYVDGYGYAIAADTGSAIKGNRIDLCFNTRAEAIKFGRRNVTVRIL